MLNKVESITKLRSYLQSKCQSSVRGDLIYAYLYGTGCIVQKEKGMYEVSDDLVGKIDEMSKDATAGDVIFDRTRGGHYLIFDVTKNDVGTTYSAVKLSFNVLKGHFCLDMTCRWPERIVVFKDGDPFIRVRRSHLNGTLNVICTKCKSIREHMKAMDQLARELSSIY